MSSNAFQATPGTAGAQPAAPLPEPSAPVVGGRPPATQGELKAHGLKVRLPEGWSGRIFRLQDTPPDRYGPAIHAGNFAINISDSGFAASLTADLAPGRVAVMYVEYPTDDKVLKPSSGLYAAEGLSPILTIDDFSARTLQVARPGHLGYQDFFTVRKKRLGVLYVVLGGREGAEPLVGQVNELIDSLELASSMDEDDFAKEARRKG